MSCTFQGDVWDNVLLLCEIYNIYNIFSSSRDISQCSVEVTGRNLCFFDLVVSFYLIMGMVVQMIRLEGVQLQRKNRGSA